MIIESKMMIKTTTALVVLNDIQIHANKSINQSMKNNQLQK